MRKILDKKEWFYCTVIPLLLYTAAVVSNVLVQLRAMQPVQTDCEAISIYAHTQHLNAFQVSLGRHQEIGKSSTVDSHILNGLGILRDSLND